MEYARDPSLALWIAPPGWGKTSLLLDLIGHLKQVIVFISPLKALSLEFHQRLLRAGLSSLLVDSRRQLQTLGPQLLNYQAVVLSYEHVSGAFARFLQSRPQKFLLVFDEFHLLFHWGNSFRPELWESFYQLAESGQDALALSATVDEGILQEIQSTFAPCFRTIQVVDQGNFSLLNAPQKVYRMRHQSELWIHLLRNLSRGRRCLVFLPFRAQVEQWGHRLRSQGWAALDCVGGKTLEFRQRLGDCPQVQVILATDALGHGVNLPPISQVFISHPVVERAMWLQMVGRGGRDGRPYRLYCMNIHGANWWQNFRAWLRNWFAVVFSWQRVSP